MGHEVLQYAHTFNGEDAIGVMAAFSAQGGGGLQQLTQAYNATYKRYMASLESNSVDIFGSQNVVGQQGISPTGFFPPNGVSRHIQRMRDEVVVELSTSTDNGPVRANWGFQDGTMEINNTGNEISAVMFQMRNNTIDASPTWRAVVTDETRALVVDVDTTIDPRVLAHLRIDIDGLLGEIRWYIDEVLVNTYTVVSGALGTSPAGDPQHGCGLFTNSNGVTAFLRTTWGEQGYQFIEFPD